MFVNKVWTNPTLSTAAAVDPLDGSAHFVCCRVDLSSASGASCPCGKVAIDIASLPIKTMAFGEVRQVVVSAFKLAHGMSLQSIHWDLEPNST